MDPITLGEMSMAGEDIVEIVEPNVRYKILQRIADGGMGSVYEATQYGAEGFEKTVAIKTVLEDYTNNKEFVEMFIGEAKLVSDLIHEHIVQVYQLGKLGGMYYIVMEYVKGVTLHQYLLQHFDSERECDIEYSAFIASRVCRGLEYAHRQAGRDGHPLGIVHRDVSPKNVMMTYEGVVKLGDFGIAKARNYMQNKEGEILLGKVEYMSPEQARYEETDMRSDIFSLGIVLYQILTGVQIFATEDVYETLDNVKDGKIPDPREYNPEIPQELARITMKALTRKLKNRYQNAGEMGNELEYYMYHDRFGPTDEKFAMYLKDLFGYEEAGLHTWGPGA